MQGHFDTLIKLTFTLYDLYITCTYKNSTKLVFYFPLGHSRTVVGIEEMREGGFRLLIFDPSTPRKQMQQYHGVVNGGNLRTIRRTLYGLKAKQYQLVAVTGVLTDQQYEEYKVLRSQRID